MNLKDKYNILKYIFALIKIKYIIISFLKGKKKKKKI